MPSRAADDGSEPLRVELADGLLTLSLHRPDRHNALDDALKQALIAAVRRASSDDSVRTVLLRGDGPSFCAGGDVRRIDAEGTRDGAARAKSMLATVRGLMVPLLNLTKPVVAAVHGHVIGAGVGVALAADVVIAGDDVRFAVPFVDYALAPDMMTGYLLARVLGVVRARALLLRPRLIGADEALALGLVADVVPVASLEATATAAARVLANGPTAAYARIKRQTGLAATTDADTFAALEAEDHGYCVDSADHAEVLRARRAGRAPVFVGC